MDELKSQDQLLDKQFVMKQMIINHNFQETMEEIHDKVLHLQIEIVRLKNEISELRSNSKKK